MECFSQLFECTPGTGFDGFLSAHCDLADKVDSLYNGLVHCKVENINTPLGLPQLPFSADAITLLPHLVCVDVRTLYKIFFY